jgi:hypothetical protein
VHADNWVIDSCPANGPAIDAIGREVVVAWWTMAGGEPHVSLAFSNDAGDTFGQPIRINAKPAAGQVTVVMLDEGRAAIIGWLEEQQAWTRWVGRDGLLGAPLALGRAPARTRLPRWIAEEDAVLALWTSQVGDDRTTQLTRLTW